MNMTGTWLASRTHLALRIALATVFLGLPHDVLPRYGHQVEPIPSARVLDRNSGYGVPSNWQHQKPLSAAALPAQSIAYPLKLSANSRFLVDQNDQPVFWSGDTAWSLIAQGTTADVDFYLNNRQQKGFNVILVNLLEHQFATNAPRNIYGQAPFTGTPFTTPNEAYFAHADYVVAAAAQRGIAVLLAPLYLGYNCGSEGWCAEVRAASSSDLQSWGQYVGNRYRGFDNIVWVIGGDVDPIKAGVSSKVTAFVTGLQQADNRHLITAHNNPGTVAVSPWTGAGWLTVNNTDGPLASAYQLGRTAYNNAPTKPYFHIEGYYENEHGITRQQLRAQAYWSVLSGGFGYLFGNCPVWHLGSTLGWCGNLTDWRSQLDHAASQDNVHVQNLFRPRAWQLLVPDWNHTVLTAGYGTWGALDYAAAARASNGSLIVAYLPSARTVTVDMSRLAGTLSASWYDPTNGALSTIAGSPFSNIGSRQFSPPGSNSAGAVDWILVLETGSPAATPTPALSTPTSTVLPPTPSQTPSPTSTSVVPSATPKATTIVPSATPTAAPPVSTATPVTTATKLPAATRTKP
jgi:hypothetical protein